MEKKRFVLEFPPECSDKPVTYHLIKDFDLKVNILRGTITAGKEGKLLIEIEAEADNIEKALVFLREEGLGTKSISQQVFVDEEKCVHCGACTAVCFSGALKMNRENWKLELDPENCVACDLCVPACPLNLITVGFEY